MSDRLTAWVRTVVPTAWAALVAWLVTLGLPPQVTGAAAGLVDVLVVPAALAAVYALLRWVEPRLPAWLAVLLLGSARAPVYPLPQHHQGPAGMGEAAQEQSAA